MEKSIVSYEKSDSHLLMTVLSYSFGHGEISQIKSSSHQKIEEESFPNLIIDLSNVDFIDSSVIGYFVNLKKILEKNDSKVSIICNNTNILKIMNMINFQKIIKISKDMEEAKNYFSSE